MVTHDQDLQIRQCNSAQQRQFACRRKITSYQCITFFRLKQYREAGIIGRLRVFRRENADKADWKAKHSISCNLHNILSPSRQLIQRDIRNKQFGYLNPLEKILQAAGVIRISMGNDQAVNMGDPLAQQSLRRQIRRILRIIATTIHHKGPAC